MYIDHAILHLSILPSHCLTPNHLLLPLVPSLLRHRARIRLTQILVVSLLAILDISPHQPIAF